MKARIAAMMAVLWLTAAAPVSLPVHVGGRAVREADGSLRFGWPATYVEARFRGPGVRVRLLPVDEALRLVVDGAARAVAPGTSVVTVDGLSPGAHTVRLEKLSESQTGSVTFRGFEPLPGTAALPPPAYARRIEFIGDSYTVGYGNASPSRACTPDEMRARTDSQRAFGPLVARRYGADYRVVAYSGEGVVRNFAGSRPGEDMPGLYARAIPGEPAAEAGTGWRSQLIVVNLGTNDFSTPVHAGERWADEAALRAAYRARYLGFVRDLHARQPRARMLLMGGPAFADDVRGIAATLAGKGLPIDSVAFGELERTGCDWHPSLADHRRLAALVAAQIDAMKGVWR